MKLGKLENQILEEIKEAEKVKDQIKLLPIIEIYYETRRHATLDYVRDYLYFNDQNIKL